MHTPCDFRIQRLTPADAGTFADLNTLFGEVFEDTETPIPATCATCSPTMVSSRWSPPRARP